MVYKIKEHYLESKGASMPNTHRSGSVVLLGISILLVITLSSCDMLFGLFSSNDVYFYSMGLDDNSGTSANYSLDARMDGYNLIMSRGQGGNPLTKAEAQTLQATTSFTVTLDSVNIPASSATTVDELSNTGWHVVQSFDLDGDELCKGAHTLVGVTKNGSSVVRTNTVYLTID